jgi:signal transduction protein with GAF and PtsI domain
MVPFVRTLDEARAVTDLLAALGLVSGRNGLKVVMMCEIPSNALLADRFLEYLDGMSIASNDLTQLVLGVDRDSATCAELFDERDEAVIDAIARIVGAARASGLTSSICGQAPSQRPEIAEKLVEIGIDSISVTPDALAFGLAEVHLNFVCVCCAKLHTLKLCSLAVPNNRLDVPILGKVVGDRAKFHLRRFEEKAGSLPSRSYLRGPCREQT